MKIIQYTGGPVETNSYLISNSDKCLLIDAPEGSWDFFSKNYSVTDLFITHQHYDHTQDAHLFGKEAKIYAFSPYKPNLTLAPVSFFETKNLLEDKQRIFWNKIEIQIFHIPGHSTDSIVFYFPNEEMVFVGDTLFEGSIGRTDLPNGNHDLLLSKIHEHLFLLPPKTKVFPGHGNATNIKEELTNNPFFK